MNLLERETFVFRRQRGRPDVVAGDYVADGEVVGVWVVVVVWAAVWISVAFRVASVAVIAFVIRHGIGPVSLN